MENGVFDPYDMDKEEFNVDLCMMSYCENYSLPRIISKQNNLDSEIQNLKGNLQSILYDNYNKVINTSKVIGNITSNFDDMFKDVELLQEKMLHLENSSLEVFEKFRPKREEMAELLKSKKNLSKLIALIELIPNLKKFIEEDEYVKAAEYFLGTEKQLKLYDHLPPCEGIVRESRELVAVIQNKLKEKTDCNVYTIEEVNKIMELLLNLGVEGEGILKDFFAQTKCHFRNILTTINRVFEDTPRLPKQEATIAESRGSKLCELGLRYIDILCKASTSVRNVFLKRDSSPHAFNVVAVLGDFITISIEELFQKLKLKFRDLFDKISNEFIANILDRLYRSWYTCCLIIPSVNINQLSAQVFLEFCHERCIFYYQTMESDFQGCMTKLQLLTKVTDVTTLEKTSTWLSLTVENIFTSPLTSLRVFISPEHKFSRNIYFRKIFSKKFVREGVFVSFIRYLLQQASIFSEVISSKRDRYNLRSCLLLSVYIRKLSQTVLRKLFNLVDESFDSPSTDLMVTPIDNLISECDTVANKMLGEFAHAWARNMSMMLIKSIDNKNWFDMKEPRKVSSVVRRVAEEFEAVVQDTEFSLPLEESTVKSSSSGPNHCQSSISRASSASMDSNDSQVMHRISKLFFRSPRYFENIKFCRDSVLSSLLELTLKCLLEHVRLETFNCYGLQQMQVDLHYLEEKAVRHLRDEEHFISLFDDILKSCIHRTVKPKFLNPQVVSALCET